MSTTSFINHTSYTQISDIERLKFIEAAINSTDRTSLRILEIGCGNGNISFQLAHNGHHVLGIDIDTQSIQKATSLFQNENLQFRVIDIYEYIVEDIDQYDVIICSEVLEHLQDPLTVMHNIHRLLKTDGMAIITVPNGNGPRELLITKPIQYFSQRRNLCAKFIFKFKRALGYSGYTPQSSSSSLSHIQFFSYKSIHKLADKSSFQITKITASSFIEKVFPFSILYRKMNVLQKLDCKVANYLPIRITSGFYLIMKKKEVNA